MSVPSHDGTGKRRGPGARAESPATHTQQADTTPLSVWGSEIALVLRSPELLVIKQIGLQFIGVGFVVIGALFLYVLFQRTPHLGWPWVVALVALVIGLLVLGRMKAIRFDRATKKLTYGFKTIPLENIGSVQLLYAHILARGKKYHQINLTLCGTSPERLNLALQPNYTSAFLKARELAEFLNVPLENHGVSEIGTA